MARTSSRTARIYPSKVDTWLAILLILSLGAAFVGVIVAGLQEGPLRVAQGVFVMLAAIGFVAWIFLGTNYTLDGRDLVVRSGPFRWRIPVDEITSVETPERQNIFLRARSSPALSMDRIAINYGRGKRIMISPADKDRFLADLRSRNSTLNQ